MGGHIIFKCAKNYMENTLSLLYNSGIKNKRKCILTMEQKKIDMTTGPIMKKVFLFAIPMVVGNILQYLYTTVDILVIGNYCGETSLAAVGTSSQPVEVLLCVFLGIGTGVSILISQYAGAKNETKMRHVVDTATFFVFVCGIPLCVIGYFIAPLILRWMGAPADTWDAGGAALSTSLAMYLSWIISIVYIRKKFPDLELSYFPKGVDLKELRQIVMIGLPIGLNNSLYSLGHVAIQSLVNAQGSVFMAGNSVAGRVTGLSNIAINALSSAATTFSGQNYGAGNFDRLRQGYIKIPVVSGMLTLAAGLCVLLFHRPILQIFTRDEAVLVYAGRYVVVLLLSQWFFAIFNGIICIVNGVGLIRYTTIVNILMLWAVRIPSAYLITRYFDGTYIMLCFPISFSFGMIMMLGYYMFSKRWKEIIRTGLPSYGQHY